MASQYIHVNDDIAAVATAPGTAALAVIRLCGPESIVKFSRLFSRPHVLCAAASHTAVYGAVVDPADAHIVDEVVAVVFAAPHGYTGQNAVDIMCHGGQAATEGLLLLFEREGFRGALPGEFSFRAFYNGKIDLSEAEAAAELISARSATAASDALKRLRGGLLRETQAVRGLLLRIAAALAVRLDYGEDESPDDMSLELPSLEVAAAACETLAATYRVGRIVQEGARVVLAGRTNAGKSSLFNRLLKEERAIVSAAHGTTRDYIEAELDMDGIPVRVIDTAGLRTHETPDIDGVETEGIRRSLTLTESADVLVYIADAALGLSFEDQAFIEAHSPAVLVWNKIDKADALPAPPEWIALSAVSGEGERVLVEHIVRALTGDRTVLGSERTLRISSARQKDALENAAAAIRQAVTALRSGGGLDMAAIDINTALEAIGEISGETTSGDILDALFSNFCVGK